MASKTEMVKPGLGAWIDTVANGVGKYVNLETSDGVQRGGRMTGIRWKKIKFNGKSVDIVHELELNGDPTDTVDIWRLASIQFS